MKERNEPKKEERKEAKMPAALRAKMEKKEKHFAKGGMVKKRKC